METLVDLLLAILVVAALYFAFYALRQRLVWRRFMRWLRK